MVGGMVSWPKIGIVWVESFHFVDSLETLVDGFPTTSRRIIVSHYISVA